MSINCSCEAEDFEWYYIPDEDYSTLNTPRRKRCQSCNVLIPLNSMVLKLNRFRSPKSDIEENVYGNEVPLADGYLCEECADLFFSVDTMSICISFHTGKSIQEMLEEYHDKDK